MFKKISLIHFLIAFIIILGTLAIYFKISNDRPTNILTEQEANIIGKTLYDKALDYYWCDFEYSKDGAISNYDEVIGLFTSNGKLNFEKALGIKKQGKKMYETESTCARESNPEYIETTLKLISVSETEIEMNATSSYCRVKIEIQENGEEEITDECTNDTVKNTFLLKKKDNVWYIDEFVLPN